MGCASQASLVVDPCALLFCRQVLVHSGMLYDRPSVRVCFHADIFEHVCQTSCSERNPKLWLGTLQQLVVIKKFTVLTLWQTLLISQSCNSNTGLDVLRAGPMLLTQIALCGPHTHTSARCGVPYTYTTMCHITPIVPMSSLEHLLEHLGPPCRLGCPPSSCLHQTPPHSDPLHQPADKTTPQT